MDMKRSYGPSAYTNATAERRRYACSQPSSVHVLEPIKPGADARKHGMLMPFVFLTRR